MKTWRRYTIEILVFAVGFLSVNAIFIVNMIHPFSESRAENAEHFGAFIGGYVGSLFSLAAMVLLYATLRNQRESSEYQDFETKYFELLKLHRANVAEIKVNEVSARRIFVLLIQEFRLALSEIQRINTAIPGALSPEQCVKAAYYAIFYGVGPASNRMLTLSLATIGLDGQVAEAIITILTMGQGYHRHELPYLPFDGHQSRLGHYYRHLYQLVCYVDKQELATLDNPKKYESVKTIRAQLSTHEQALLLINSLTPVGHNWWEVGLIEKYRLVKNIPRDFFDPNSEIDTEKIFPPGYFEWQEAADHCPRPAKFIRA